ncbi:MAG: uracil-DNA glycosylase [Acidimicrobiaceae bacterium]|nr:MAG: uracil-DNA glycosylase [Acidimicrobiaceae bacterium]
MDRGGVDAVLAISTSKPTVDVVDSLVRLHDDVGDCRLCPRLVDWRERVAIEKRAAYRHDEYWGRGVAGFGRAMHRAGFADRPTSVSVDDGLTLIDAWVTAAVKCAPPGNAPLPDERTNCRPFLVRELALLHRLRVIVCLGGFAYEAACRHFGVRPKPKFGHGVEVTIDAGAGRSLGLLCSFHPSQQNTFTGRLTEPMLDAVFTRAGELARCP